MSELLTVNEIAGILRVNPASVRRWIRDGALEAITLPQRGRQARQSFRIKRATLNKVLGEEEVKA